jgi:hypothetical protein
MIRTPWAAVLVLLAACGSYRPPAPPSPRDATEVAASVGRTWDAVIDLFAARNIPIRTIERSSGIIATEPLIVGPEGRDWADCGTEQSGRLRPNTAIYNVLVRGDSGSATVRATVRWSRILAPGQGVQCSTTDVWERSLESGVKARAEDPKVVFRGSRKTGGRPGKAVPAPAPGPARAPAPAPAAGAAPPDSASSASLGAQVPRTGDAYQPPGGYERSNNDLLTYPGFKQSIEDMLRKRMVLTYREAVWSRLELELSASAFNEPTLEYLMTQLYLGYSQTMGGNINTKILIRAGGQPAGEYTRNGLHWYAAGEQPAPH